MPPLTWFMYCMTACFCAAICAIASCICARICAGSPWRCTTRTLPPVGMPPGPVGAAGCVERVKTILTVRGAFVPLCMVMVQSMRSRANV